MLERGVVIRVGQPAWKPAGAEDMHGEKSAVKEDERQEKMHLAPELVHHPAEHFWKPKINSAEHAKRRAAEQHVVNVPNDEVRVVDEDIDRRGGHEDAR